MYVNLFSCATYTSVSFLGERGDKPCPPQWGTKRRQKGTWKPVSAFLAKGREYFFCQVVHHVLIGGGVVASLRFYEA